MRRAKYKTEYPRLMYTFFVGWNGGGAPSFSKFARSVGLTLNELESFRKRSEFDAAWRECSEIRRDYLIDSALTRRHDPSFTKQLLALEYEQPTEGCEDFTLTIKVLGDDDEA